MATRALLTVALAVMFLGLPGTARADGILAGFVGVNFNRPEVVIDDQSRSTVYGGVIGGVQPRGLGFEVDFGYSPDFFGSEDSIGAKASLTTLMGNLVVGGAAARGVGPYVSGGVGLIRANIETSDLFEDLTSNEFGMNVGGGVNVMFASNVGVRADVRYFRAFQSEDEDDDIPDFGTDLADFSFWRGAVGVVLRW